MKLFSQTLGQQGPDLVLLHGWGLHSGVWEETAAELAQRFRVTLIDLPGHGQSPVPAGRYTLSALAQALAAVAPAPAAWIGWSLGALAAMQVALLHPAQVNRLALVTATPRFTQTTDWPHAVAPQVLDEFHTALAADHHATLRRFLALQLRGSEGARATQQQLEALLFQQGTPNLAGLNAGLALLRDSDLRRDLAAIHCPTLVAAGERDTLTPPAAQRYLAEHLPHAQLSVIAGAGHAPFLSHNTAFMRVLHTFLQH